MKPILFNTDMVRAILDNRKTVTRRVVKGYAIEHLELDTDGSIIGVYNQFEGHVFPVMDYAPYRPGDILYVRETFQVDYLSNIPGSGRIHYKADDSYADFSFPACRYEIMRRAHLKPGWRPNENMPREAARIFLRVTDVRVERLQNITPAQLRAEGIHLFLLPSECSSMFNRFGAVGDFMEKRKEFSEIWDGTINKADRALYGWAANPWVWVIEFERISREEAIRGD